ncbi:MAG: LysM peptidoglycan-binding domain-containing protein, partial [Clostridia bacterium]
MVIYVVKPGDTLYTIGQKYGVSAEKIASDNELTQPNNLVVGQTIVVLLENKIHIVKAGESLYSIAKMHNVALDDLISANPEIEPPYSIFPGQEIVVPLKKPKLGTYEVNGFAFPNIRQDVIDKALGNLSYLSLFSYQVSETGSLTEIPDTELVTKSRSAGVAPLMVITNISEDGGFSGEITNSIFASSSAQNTLIANVLQTLKSKNYYGLVVDFEYIFPSDRDNYTGFLIKLTDALHKENYKVFVAVAPKTSGDQQGTLYEAHDYGAIGSIADKVIIMTYEWGYTYGPPLAVAPINLVKKVLDYAVTVIPSRKILMGIPNYGYDWTLPFVQGTAATVVGNVGAVDLAREKGAFIQFDETSQAPFFNYYATNGKEHVVWFEDARSINAKLNTA